MPWRIILLWRLTGAVCGEEDWQRFERRVRDEQISYEDGLKEIRHWWDVLQHAYPAERFDGRLFFPVKGYGLKHVGGRNGSGYRPSRYEFVGPNRRIGHPAQDIFVYDGNQDGLDDRTGKPVEVLAVADGIVLSTFSDWMPTPRTRKRQTAAAITSGSTTRPCGCLPTMRTFRTSGSRYANGWPAAR